MKKIIIVVLVLVVGTALEVLAQTPPPGGSSTEGAPLDGMTSLLLAAGVGYGYKQLKKQKEEV